MFISLFVYTLPAHALKSLYYSLIHCHMMHGLQVAQSVDKIYILQNEQYEQFANNNIETI